MPQLITDPAPCPAQRALMESLGFQCFSTDNSDVTPWVLPLENARTKTLWIKLNNRAVPTLPEITQKLANKAHKQGHQDVASSIKQLLHIKEDER